MSSVRLDLQYPAGEFPARNVAWRKGGQGILVKVSNWLGDAVMNLPAVVQLRTVLPPGGKIAVLAAGVTAELFRAVPQVDMVFVIPSAHKMWPESLCRQIRDFHASGAVILTNSLRDTLQLRLCNVGPVYGAAARGRSIFLKRSFNFIAPVAGQHNPPHQLSQYLALAYALGAERWDGKFPDILPEGGLEHLPDIFLKNNNKVLILAAGAAYGAAKRWSSESFCQLSKLWIERGGAVAMVGSRGERQIGEEIFKSLPAEQVANLAGETDFAGLCQVLRAGCAIAANDSGVMHLAAALGRPGVAVFGPTDYVSTGPIGEKWECLYVGEEGCSPCFCRECPKQDARCMSKITPEMVLAALDRVLEK